MNQLITKEVNFNGAPLMATKLDDEDKVYVGVKWVCEGIGLTEGQIKNERKKIQEDLLLKQGGRNLVLPTNSGNQEVLCIELSFLPLWLARISITPKMQRENPFVVKNLMEYQLKAKDVLAQAFIKENNLSPELKFLAGLLNQMKQNELNQKRLENAQLEQQDKIIKLETSFNEESNVEGYVTNGNIARKLHLYSTTGRPHEKFVDGVARELNIYNNKIGYVDEYIKVVRETNGGVVTGVAYYTPLGVELIEKYVKDNFNPTKQIYVRGAKKGQFNKSFFTIRESNYFFNEETQKRYKQ